MWIFYNVKSVHISRNWINVRLFDLRICRAGCGCPRAASGENQALLGWDGSYLNVFDRCGGFLWLFLLPSCLKNQEELSLLVPRCFQFLFNAGWRVLIRSKIYFDEPFEIVARSAWLVLPHQDELKLVCYNSQFWIKLLSNSFQCFFFFKFFAPSFSFFNEKHWLAFD